MDNKLIQLVLSRFISNKTSGFEYICEITDMYAKLRNGEIKYLWNNKVQIVADKHNSTYGAVVRACNYQIKRAWESGIELRRIVFKDMPYRPTLTEFCSTIADFVRNNEKELTDNTFWETQDEER